MRSARLASLLSLALLAASGCRTAGVDSLARREAPVVPQPAFDVSGVIDEHNRNAERIQVLEGQAALAVTASRRHVNVDGAMALERPRNFKLDVFSNVTGAVADIGSNDKKFWYWVKDNKDHLSYYCNYEDLEANPISATFQPDWIIEALGLRVIPEAESKGITVTRGPSPDTVVLTHPPTKFGGETVVRKTVVRETGGRVVEYQLYSDRMKLLAKATIARYQSIPIAGDGAEGEAALVPQKLTLHWVAEDLTMDVTFRQSSLKVNQPITEDRKSALFVEEPHKGYQRYNLAAHAPPRQGRMEIYESLPPPPTRAERPVSASGVELGVPEPVPMGVEGASRTRRDPLALMADLPAPDAELVGPAIPKPPEPRYARPAPSGWRSSDTSFFER